ncbi:hypothetical protein IG631_17414 [Alternaria alternata]|nr:hypothetical protein IG631_17414 [Alternaria alternata]
MPPGRSIDSSHAAWFWHNAASSPPGLSLPIVIADPPLTPAAMHFYSHRRTCRP